MCGRFSLRARLAVLLEHFAIDEQFPPSFSPRYNIAPSQPIFVVREKPDASSPAREAVMLRWGLIPSWATDPAIGNRMINARSETIAEKPAFRAAFQRRRCLVAADGFYEWKTEGRAKQPYFLHFPDDRPFAFAGLWDRWEGPDNSDIETCTILTTDANEQLRPIHDRMPVIVQPCDYARWLEAKEQDSKTLLPMLSPYPRNDLEVYPVSRQVNSPRHDAPDCLSRLPEEKSLFS
jgi:putative SOS response-associated peptidase YedK